MEKKIVVITVTGHKIELVIETRKQLDDRLIKTDPGIKALRNDSVESSIAHTLNKFANQKDYSFFVNKQDIRRMASGREDSLGQRFLNWLKKYDAEVRSNRIG